MQETWSLQHAAADRAAREAESLDGFAVRAAQGDKAAFEQIYVVLADDLYSFVRSQVRDDTMAEDLVANVFLKAWRSARRYRGGSLRFRQWIFAIARNEVRDHWRTLGSTLPMSALDLVEDETHVDNGVLANDARRLVATALSVLTVEQREVVVLRYFSNKTHEEIATIMGKREGAVRALLLRALRHMRKVMVDAAP